MHVAHKNEKLIQQQQEFQKLVMPVFELINKYEVPPNKTKEIFDYTTLIFSKFNRADGSKKMSNERVARKVVEHFKLKIKSHEEKYKPAE